VFEPPTRPLGFPPEGTRRNGLLYRLPTIDDVETVAPVFADEAIGGAANMLPLSVEEVRALAGEFPAILERGLLLPLLVADAETGEVYGGGNLHNFNWAHGQAEIGYWLLHDARGRGIATRTARFLAEHGFSLGLERIEARVFVGNDASERVLERAGFTREGVLRSLPRRWGGRADMTVYSLLPGE
jgi:RimJ/RimL family protein N-acetyltransferase